VYMYENYLITCTHLSVPTVNVTMYIPNSKKVALTINWSLALGIGHWALGHTEHNAMLCLSDPKQYLPNAQSNL